MKTNLFNHWLALGATLLVTSVVLRASADEPAPAGGRYEHYTGTVVSVDPQEHVLKVQGWFLFKKTFNLGDPCVYRLWQKPDATAANLRTGQKVKVSYQNIHGVLIANQIQQQLMQYDGTVKAIDSKQHTLTLHWPGWDKQLRIANDCPVVLRDDKSGTLADLHPGDQVTVIYEEPNGQPTARQIAQTSRQFTGTLTAIDLTEKTVKATSLFETKKFNVADNCAIMVNGKINGKLSDLRPDARLVFNYDEINGVNVANRIAPMGAAEETTNSIATSTASAAGS